MRPLAPRVLVASAACTAVLSCGSIPSLADGIAFISPIALPAPAVAVNDTLRDSLGRVSPLVVQAFDQNDKPVTTATTSFVVVTLPPGVKIDANGIVTAFDSIRTVQVVGRVGERLQTATTNLEVVAQPDLMTSVGSLDSLVLNQSSSALQVAITGDRRGARVGVAGIVVRYRIVSTTPSRNIDPTLLFFSDGVRGDLSRAVDTTTVGSLTTSRTIIATDLTGLTAINVEATATNLRGAPLAGSPVRFAIPVKKGG